MRIVTVKIPEDLDRALDLLAERQGVSRSAVIRQALEALTGARSWSVAALAADLAGTLSGPRDLSTSAKHLTGYGE